MQITKKEWDSICKYIKDKIMDEIGPNSVIKPSMISGAIDMLTMEEMLTATGEKKEKKKAAVIDPMYKEAWAAWWKLWPSTKSVPGTQYKSGAVMKKDEARMYAKWLTAIQTDSISIPEMHYAAACYLQWAYEDSKRLGKNELHHRSGMEPWLNGKVYIQYMNIEMPKIEKRIVYDNSTDQ